MASKQDYNQGYNDAVEAIKKILSGENNGGDNSKGGGGAGSPGGGQGQGSQSGDGRDMDLSGTAAGKILQQQQGNQIMNNPQNSQQGQGRGQGDQGQVTNKDCSGQFGQNAPSTPGSIMSVAEGNKLAEKEGYPPGSPSDDSVGNDWKEVAVEAAKKSQGKGKGAFVSKIFDIWKTTSDWKKAFKKIVGHSLNTQDKRSAYANKNVLATRNMVARTDKDKYDCIDYMLICTDSSGSVSDKDLQYMLSEIYNIAYSIKPETLVVCQFDTRITDVQIFKSPAEFKKYTRHATVKGRGGTDCKCIWDLLKTDKRFARHAPELVIIMTDGYLDQYRRDPKKMNNLCWVIVDNPGWEVQNKDPKTMCVHLDSKDIKK